MLVLSIVAAIIAYFIFIGAGHVVLDVRDEDYQQAKSRGFWVVLVGSLAAIFLVSAWVHITG